MGMGINTSRRCPSAVLPTGAAGSATSPTNAGQGRNGNLTLTVRPAPAIELNSPSSFTDVRTDTDEFTIRIYRLLTTYQFTERLLLRSIVDYNNYDRTLGGTCCSPTA
jgi:hypothetical protein